MAIWPEQLPEELLVEILSRLLVQPLLRFRCVSKTWKSLIDSPSFVKSHLLKNPNSKMFLFQNLEYGSFGLPRISLYYAEVDLLDCSGRFRFQSLPLPLAATPYANLVLGSCDGLLCLSTHLFKEIVLLNPSTREYRLLPPISESINEEYYYEFGLGYDCSADEYKVVLIPEKGSEVYIYGSKSNSWRQINVSSNFKFNSVNQPCYGKYTNGALHWIVGDRDEPSFTMNTFQIVEFDLVSEKFTIAEYYADLFGNPSDVGLEVMAGQLCLSCGHDFGEGEVDYVTDIWLMKEYGVRESWSKLVSFDTFITLVAFSNCGRRLLLEDLPGYPNSSSLKWYDLDQKSMECIDNTGNAHDYAVCLQSLIRLEQKLPLRSKKKQRKKRGRSTDCWFYGT